MMTSLERPSLTASNSILVVGYDSDTSRILDLWLSHLGYRVCILDDPDRVLEIAVAIRPRLVITNYPTRLSSGDTVVEAVRATSELAGTRVLNLTTRAFNDELAAATVAGASLSLPMPVSLYTIAEQIARLIGRPTQAVLDRAEQC